MTDRPDEDAFARELRQSMEDSIRPVAEQVIADAVRPWKRLTFWLAIGYSVFVVLSILQALVYR